MAKMGTNASNTSRPKARYAYYRRCQVFRRNGEQCKAPAEKGAQICHAHAGQMATALRRNRERQAVLAEAVAEMRRRGKITCERNDLFMDFNGIQVTIAVVMRALIAGRMDCKAAGRLAWELQMSAKILRIYERTKARTSKDTHSIPLSQAQRRSGQATERKVALIKEPSEIELKVSLPQVRADDRRSGARKGLPQAERRFVLRRGALNETGKTPSDWAHTSRIVIGRNSAHGPPGWARAA